MRRMCDSHEEKTLTTMINSPPIKCEFGVWHNFNISSRLKLIMSLYNKYRCKQIYFLDYIDNCILPQPQFKTSVWRSNILKLDVSSKLHNYLDLVRDNHLKIEWNQASCQFLLLFFKKAHWPIKNKTYMCWFFACYKIFYHNLEIIFAFYFVFCTSKYFREPS